MVRQYILSLIGVARMDFSYQYYIEGKARDVRCNDKSISSKTNLGPCINEVDLNSKKYTYIDLRKMKKNNLKVIKFTSYLPMVSGSLRVLRLLPPLKLVAMI